MSEYRVSRAKTVWKEKWEEEESVIHHLTLHHSQREEKRN